jgi:outer membrane protein OmpA-like peptidoglycan-associated protein
MKRIAIAATLAIFLAGCSTDPYTGEQKLSNTAAGATTGAILGAAAGIIVGGTTSVKTRKAALIGAGLGALTGGGIGLYMDNQEAKLRERLARSGVSVTRQGQNIVLNMPSNITFDSDEAAVKPQFFDTLDSVALVLNEFDRTLIDVYGHTDSDGTEQYNYDLSRDRAAAVARFLSSRQVNPRRFSVEGFGEARPIASNETAAGKAQNRRVEIVIAPLT